jgi:hypothetical protein
MAFGFTRQAGTGRGYVNVSNPDYAIGDRLARRQYDKYIERLGKRTHLPGAEAIRETERLLEQLRVRLDARESELDAREAAVELAERELALEQALFRKGRQNAGQRRYNALLEAYVSEQRRRGNRSVNKLTAKSSPAFKQLVADVKGRANKRNNPIIRDANRFTRMKALDQLGGSNVFREYYEKLYGSITDGTIGKNVRARARGGSARIKQRR